MSCFFFPSTTLVNENSYFSFARVLSSPIHWLTTPYQYFQQGIKTEKKIQHEDEPWVSRTLLKERPIYFLFLIYIFLFFLIAFICLSAAKRCPRDQRKQLIISWVFWRHDAGAALLINVSLYLANGQGQFYCTSFETLYLTELNIVH